MANPHEVYANFDIKLHCDDNDTISSATYDTCFFDSVKMSDRSFAWCELSLNEEKNQHPDDNKKIVLLKFLHQESR